MRLHKYLPQYSVLLAIVIVAGCAGMASGPRLEKFELTARAYERALRWGDYQSAFALAGIENAFELGRLQEVRVTSYEVQSAPQANDDGSEVTQVVEIRYANVRRMSERVFVDRQRWVYSANDKRWKLGSAFPAFP